MRITEESFLHGMGPPLISTTILMRTSWKASRALLPIFSEELVLSPTTESHLHRFTRERARQFSVQMAVSFGWTMLKSQIAKQGTKTQSQKFSMVGSSTTLLMDRHGSPMGSTTFLKALSTGPISSVLQLSRKTEPTRRVGAGCSQSVRAHCF